MSTQVDQRVVSMQFDNKNFEKNVQTSMSTLDKLKEKLNLSGAAKGLDSVNKAASKVNLNGLNGAVETVRTRFSAMEVVGVTALANIANSAVNAGKQLVKSLTVAPIMDGFREYEMTLNAVQTTMAGTGKTAQEVEKELKKLDEYADKTVYSTADMLNNLPKFTNAGVELETATTAMIGIANATALAGGDASKASIAFYNLGQAIGTGYLTRMDYNSINNAGIATMEWKQQMVDAAIAAGTLKKAGDGLYQSGKKTYTIQQLFIDGLQTQWATTDVMLKVFGDYGDETTAIGKKAQSAAQDIKSFSQMMESLKATAGTGWKDTWQLIFGGLDEAKKFWTDLSDRISGVINKMADLRNTVLGGALNISGAWKSITDKLGKSNLGKSINNIAKAVNKVKGVTKNLEYFQDVVNKVWRGDYKNSDTGRFELLEKAGYDHRVVQDLVNKGYKYKLTMEDVEASHKKFGLTMEKSSASTKEVAKSITDLTDEQLKQAGLTEDEISLFRAMSKEADRLGISVDDLAKKMSEKDGRTMLIDSFKNLGSSVVGIFKAIGQAWSEIFNPGGTGQLIVTIYRIIEAINKFTEKLRLTDKETGKLNENGEKIKRTLKGIFAALDIVLTVVSGPLKIAFKLLTEILSWFGITILDVTAGVGDVIVKFRDWLKSILDFSGLSKWLFPIIEKAVTAVRNWIEAAKPLEKIAGFFKKVATAISDLAKAVWNSDIVQGIVSGLVNGLKAGATAVWNAIKNLAKGMIDTIKKVLGIHSPSTEFESVGSNVIAGLINGLKKGVSAIFGFIKNLGSKMIGFLSKIEWSKVFSNIGGALKTGASSIGKVFGNLWGSITKAVGSFDWSKISTVFYNLANLFPQLNILKTVSSLGNIFKTFGGDTMSGLASGLGKGASVVWDTISSIATSVIDTFKKILGIHSPSKVFFAIGGFIIAGLLGGLMNHSSDISGAFATLGKTIADIFKGLDLNTIIAAGLGITALIMVKKVISSLLGIAKDFASAAKGFGKMTTSISSFVDNLNNKLFGGLKPSKWTTISQAIQRVAIAIAILVASVIALTLVDETRLWPAVGALATIAGIVAGLAAIIAALSLIKGSEAFVAIIGNTLLKLSAAIAIMVIVTKMLGNMDSTKLEQGIDAIESLVIMMAAIMLVTRFIGKTSTVDKIGKVLFKIATAIGIMVLVAKLAGGMDRATLEQGATAITFFATLIIGLMIATKAISGSKNVDNIGKVLFKIATAIGIMVLVAKLAGGMRKSALKRGAQAITYFSLLIVGLMAVTKLINGSKNVDTIGGTIFKIAAAIGIMVLVAKLAGSMDRSTLKRGSQAITYFSLLIIGLMAATKLITGSTNVKKIGGALIGIAGAIAIMVVVAKIAAAMSPEELIKGTLAIAAFAGIIIALMWATKLITGSKNIDKMSKIILMMAAAIGVMAVSVALLSLLDPTQIAVATAAISALMGMFALILKQSKNVTKAMGPLIILTAAIAVMGGAIFLVGQLPVANALAAAGSLSGLMLALTGVLYILSNNKIKKKNVMNAALCMLLLCAPLAGIAGALTLMGGAQNSIANAISLTILMGAMAGLLYVLSRIKVNMKDMLMGVVGMVALLIPLYGIVGALALMSGVQNAMTNATALSLLMTALGAVLILVSVAGAIYAATGGLALLGLVGIVALLIPLYAIVGALALMDGMQNATTSANALCQVLLAMGVVLTMLAIVGPLALVGVAAITALTVLIGVIGVFAVAVGALMEACPQLQAFLDTGLQVLIQIAGGIGEMIGAFVAGIATQLAAALPGIGLALSEFMINATPFLTGIKMVDSSMLKNVGILTAAIVLLTAASFLDSIMSFLSGGSSLADLGTKLSEFMINATPFIMMSRMIDPAIMTGVKTLAEAILILTGSNILDGIASFITGESSLDKFGKQLGGLGTNLKSFINNLGTFTDDQVAAVDCAGRAIKALAGAASEIPNEGGLWGAIVGENSLAKFGGELPGLGTNLGLFMKNLGTFDESKVTTVDCAGRAIKALAEAASEIPNEGGMWASIVGDNSLAKFGNDLPKLATNISGFIKNLNGFGEDKIPLVDCACEAINALAECAQNIDGQAEWTKVFCGDNSLSTFAADLPAIGTHLSNFVKNLGGMSDDKVNSVYTISSLLEALSSLGSSEYDDLADSLEDIIDALEEFSEGTEEFVSNLGEISAGTITASINKIKSLIEVAKTVSEFDADGIDSFTDAIVSLAEDGVQGFVDAFNSDTSISKIKDAAVGVIKAFVDKIKEKSSVTSITSACKTTFTSVVTAISGKGKDSVYSQMSSAGGDLVAGLVAGITSKENLKKAYNAGYKLGQEAVRGEKDGQDSNSPSKLTMKAGKWLGEGLIIGMQQMGKAVYAAGNDLGSTASNTITSAVSRISDAINSDIDTQPTIRPVLDLSNISEGVRAIDGMFGLTPSVGVLSNVRSINSMMANRQNGNDEVVSAIKDLKKTVGTKTGDTYQIGGITYDDGSAVSDAVSALVRAARIERRT